MPNLSHRVSGLSAVLAPTLALTLSLTTRPTHASEPRTPARKITAPPGAGTRTHARQPSRTPAEAGSPARARNPAGQNRRVKVWVNAFIPYKRIDMFVKVPALGDVGYCFLGDDRGFSDAADASCRTHQEVEFEVTPFNTVRDVRSAGETHKVDCKSGKELARKQAKVDRIVNRVTQLNAEVIRVKMSLAANNPLVFGAPDIDLELFLDLNLPRRELIITGAHDGFPAYEVYVSIEGMGTRRVHEYDPGANTIFNHKKLFPPTDVTVAKWFQL